MAALERAYENQKMVGKFPGCVLQLQVKASTVDVNVHPAKTEVKFLYERKAFDGVYYAVFSALNGEDRHPAMAFSSPAKAPTPAPKAPENRGASSRCRPRNSGPDRPSGTPLQASLLRPVEKAYTPVYTPLPRKNPRLFPQNPPENPPIWGEMWINRWKMLKTPGKGGNLPRTPVDTPPPRPPGRQRRPPPCPPAARRKPRPRRQWKGKRKSPGGWPGEILQTYLIVEQGDEIHFIDKHAAHERMNFDRMKAAGYQPMAQTLLAPVVFTPPPEEGGGPAGQPPPALPLRLRLRGVRRRGPGGPGDPRLLGARPGGARPVRDRRPAPLRRRRRPQAARDAVLHTMACKAAVKGGQKNSREELLVVVREVMAGHVKYCPHGRPVAITMTRGQLERQFKRS